MTEEDRRMAPRHTPSCNRVWIAWGEQGEVRRAEVHLDDLSSVGAAILIDEPLHSEGPVWLGLEGLPLSEGVIADIVRVVPQEGGTCRVGLRFTGPCALGFFRKAIWGPAPTAETATAPESPRRDLDPPACWSERWRRAQGLIAPSLDGRGRSLSGTLA